MKLTKFELIEIEELEKYEYKGDTFDIEVEKDCSYNIEGIVVHNSACTTRKLTGVGRPQFSAVVDCANVAHGMNALICSDGGCVVPGDVAKAFGAGADFVMMGGMLSGHDECGGEVVRVGSDQFVNFYGMSSATAMNKHNGGVASYRSSEGRSLLVPYRGPVVHTAEHIEGGIRSSMTYIGAEYIKEVAKCAKFSIVTNQLNTSLAQYDKGN